MLASPIHLVRKRQGYQLRPPLTYSSKNLALTYVYIDTGENYIQREDCADVLWLCNDCLITSIHIKMTRGSCETAAASAYFNRYPASTCGMYVRIYPPMTSLSPPILSWGFLLCKELKTYHLYLSKFYMHQKGTETYLPTKVKFVRHT